MATVMDTATAMAMTNRLPLLHPLALTLALAFISAAHAQQNVAGAIAAPAIGTPGSVSAGAPEQNTGRAWSFKPRIGVAMTATDNVNIGGGNARGDSDLITELSPGIRIDAQTARLRGYFDYSLRGQFYAKSNGDRRQNALNAFATLEAIDDWFFVDVSGNISQQAISAFGTQSPSDSTLNNNSTETATYRLSPYVRGQIGGLADYTVRYNASTTRADATNASDVDLGQWVAQLRGGTPFQSLKWSVDGNRQTTDYSNGRKTDADLLRLLATYLITPQFSISASGGWERNNYASLDQESRSTYGYGFDWKPTPRTQVSAFKEDRFFGNGHRFSVSHRFPMSSIRYSDTRDVSVLNNQFANTVVDPNLALIQSLVTQLCTLRSDPNASQSVIDACIAQALGPNFNSQVTSGFLSSQVSVQRQQQLAFVLFGVRNSISLQLNRSENSSILAISARTDDFSQSTVVRQQGISLNFSHRLSALSNLNASASRQESRGQNGGTNNQKASTTLYTVSVSTKLGAKTTGSLSLRRSDFDSTTNPYTENALLGALNFTY
ncbi:MAG: TIGR03016 family PEP-CTERM system-associated outer membrane protein [Betaproteobacteria bacterium HGW-Betaproteobacteria-12]|nr:MAG: TIGR03016 family PEP-CTERM system-associated outer membrane protein [Betaproteobacteria bacterium HGW-Betaproteobacteria-12]